MLQYLVRFGWSTPMTVYSGCSVSSEAQGAKTLASLEKAKLVIKRVQGERSLWQATDKGRALMPAPAKGTRAAADASASQQSSKPTTAAKPEQQQRREQRRKMQDAVYEYVRKHPRQTAAQIAAAVGADSVSVANGILYSFLERDEVGKTQDVPPLWFI
jgi:hypothetical protein